MTDRVRRRNAATTRASILKAAQIAFSTTGYSHTGIRQIGAMAGTTATMLGRYFGSKARLFEEALIDAMHVDRLLLQPHANLGSLLAQALLDNENEIRPPLMIAMAAGDPEAKEIAMRVIERELLRPLSGSLAGADTRSRALAMVMLVTGFITYARQLPIASGEDQSQLSKWFSETLQALIDGDPVPARSDS